MAALVLAFLAGGCQRSSSTSPPTEPAACAVGTHRCGDACVSDDAPSTCGSRCEPCPGAPTGYGTCTAGACGCASGYHACGSDCVLDASVASCGSSCTPCPQPAADGFATCDGHTCGTTCDYAHHACGTECLYDGFPASCGASCTACTAPEHAVPACTRTSGPWTCNHLCTGGFFNCGDACCTAASQASRDYWACLLTSSGGVKCWGAGGSLALHWSDAPLDVPGLEGGAVSIAVGYTFGCAVLADGGVACWGDNASGQLGDGTNLPAPVAVRVKQLTDVVEVAVGRAHACARTSAGAVKCWGENEDRQLGDETTYDSSLPVDVTGVAPGAEALALSSNASCAIVSGAAWCWGYPFGATPSAVAALGGDVAALSFGGYHACLLRTSGGLECWGANNEGQLGNGTNVRSEAPTPVSGLGAGVLGVSAGTVSTCAWTSSGAASCWGSNSTGQLGDGTYTQRFVPTPVAGLGEGVRAVSAGQYHGCALLSSGGVKCWGIGALGNGVPQASSLTPVDVIGNEVVGETNY